MPTRRRLAAVLTLLVAIVLFGVPPAAASFATDVGAAINASRSQQGLAALTMNSNMNAVAQAWAENLASVGSLSHNPSYSTQIPGGWSRAAENVATASRPTAAGMHQQFMNSAPHKANILGSFTHIGIGYATDSSGTGWLVEVFAAYPGSLPGDTGGGSSSGGSGGAGGSAGPGASSATATPSPTPTVPEGWLGPGSSGAEVEALQQNLADLGYPVSVDGDFGDQTAEQVRAFQAATGLTADGLVGPATAGAIEAAVLAAATPTPEPTTETTTVEPTTATESVTPEASPTPATGQATLDAATTEESSTGSVGLWIAAGLGLAGGTAVWLVLRRRTSAR